MKDWLRLVFVSPECLLFVTLAGGFVTFPGLFAHIGGGLLSNSTARVAVTGGAVSLLTTTGAVVFKVAFPRTDNRALVEWPGYQLLMNRLKFAGAVTVFGLLSGLALHFIPLQAARWVGFLATIAILPGMASLLSLGLAALEVRAITEQLDDD